MIVAARGLAGGGGAAVAGGHQFQGLGLGRAHAAGGQTQTLRPLGHLDHGADQVALLAPQFEKAAAVRLAHRIAGGAHVEEHTAIFEQRRRRVVCEIFLDALGQVRGRRSLNARRHAGSYQPCRARRPVMCAVWWRACQSYMASALAKSMRPRSG